MASGGHPVQHPPKQGISMLNQAVQCLVKMFTHSTRSKIQVIIKVS